MVLYPNKLPESERVCSGICKCTIEIVDNIVNTVLVSLSIPITKCIDALNVFYKSHS